MVKSYRHVKAIAQDDRNGCWSASMAWWTRAMHSVANWTDDEIMVEFSDYMGKNGGLAFPSGFRKMLEDPRWRMTVKHVAGPVETVKYVKAGLEKGPIMCGYFENAVGGYHAVALYGLDNGSIWAMDPNGGKHILRDYYHIFGSLQNPVILGYQE